jgi:hypothetical protein
VSVGGHRDEVLDADPDLPGDVDPGLHGDDVPRRERDLALAAEPRPPRGRPIPPRAQPVARSARVARRRR